MTLSADKDIGMTPAWSHLPEPLRAQILLRVAETVQRLCSLSMHRDVHLFVVWGLGRMK